MRALRLSSSRLCPMITASALVLASSRNVFTFRVVIAMAVRRAWDTGQDADGRGHAGRIEGVRTLFLSS